MSKETTDLYDVVAVDYRTTATRLLAMDKSKKDAEAIVKMALMRPGADDEFFKAVPAGSMRAGCVQL